ncbi:MAG: acetyl-CoA carboxylase biotin carboxylase subunit [Acidobacteria bacterium]|nr:acetyl-CoA carboxylase biotin carboxylase subunit [Acidobacteriota bacterium]
MRPPKFRKVLVANRGEIAVRVIRALRELGIASVAVYSDTDRDSLAVRMANEAVHLGAAASSESYLAIEKIIGAAQRTGAQAIHPGYGFLSENADFAEACERAGIVFIGPPAAAIRKLGSKTAARRLAIAAGAPVVPGVQKPVLDLDDARHIAAEISYPVILKAAAGGGGKGMRRVNTEGELEAGLRDASSEAERSFKSSEVYIEKLVTKPRHIEIQILGDRDGHVIHLGERECSLQRRHQKVVEECPSPVMLACPELRHAMGEAALRVARAAGYYNAGTCEFLVDEHRNFYFLEMNTRLQVEHPVTELVTGLDLVHWQLRIAAGESLALQQEDIHFRGSAIECRVYAEDPEQNYMPSPGKILGLKEPSGPGIRIDSGVYPGWTVPMDYDPLLAKLAVWAEDRPSAIRRMLRAVREYSVTGIQTNLRLFQEILEDTHFDAGLLHTGFLDEMMARRGRGEEQFEMHDIAAIVAAFHVARQQPQRTAPSAERTSLWRSAGRTEVMR